MSNTISKEEVQKVAKLGRINISDQEQEKFAKDLSGILDHFKDLSQLDISDAEPVNFLATEENQVREDVERDNGEDEKENIKKQFPDREGNYLKVKAVL